MSSFILCICLVPVFFSIGYGFVEWSLGLHNIHLVNSFLDSSSKRIKRDSDDACALTCATSMKSNIDTNAPELNQLIEDLGKDPNSITAMSKSQFQKFCQTIINPALSCMDKCYSSSLLTTLLRKTMVPARFVCRDHYDDMISNYDCLRSAENVTKVQCENGKCKDMNQAPVKLIQQSKSLAESQDFGTLKKLFADNCDYASCTMHCEKPIIAKMCNERIANLTQNDLIGTSMQSSKELLAVAKMDKSVWSAQCDKIITETGYGSAAKSAGGFALISLLLVMLLKLN